MTAWATLRRIGIGVGIFLIVAGSLFPVVAVAADDPAKTYTLPNTKPTANQLRATAEAAEKASDWDAAFTAYCNLIALDRSTEVRERLNAAMRRAQQLRRHRDPQFQRFAASIAVSDALNLFGEVMTKVPVLYADRDRCTPQLLWESGIEELSRALANPTFRQVFLDSAAGEHITDKLDGFRAGLRFWARQPIADARTSRTTLRKLILSLQESSSVRVPAALVLEMICGSCSGLDEYTVFLNPVQVSRESAAAMPDLSTQGVYLEISDGELFVAGIASGSWAAYHNQLRKGDRIVRINGRSMDMATPHLVIEALRAVAGDWHRLEIAVAGLDDPPLEVVLPVNVPTVYGAKMLKDGIGCVRIGSFAPSTPRELDSAITQLKMQGLRALIVDLRGNMGGSFLSSVETAKRLLPNGLIVATQGQLSEVANQTFSSDSGMTAHDVPLVVLIDAETASAAEVLAAALKDNGRATLIGMPTFGKGAIQYPLKLVSLDDVDEQGKPRTNRSGVVRLTIAKLIAPRSGAINGVGITPHLLEADPEHQLIRAVEKALELQSMSPRPALIP